MSLLHALAAHDLGHVQGQQSSQRDCSPLLVHFTSWQAMAPLRRAVAHGNTPKEIAAMFAEADERSFAIAELIAASGTLRAGSPSDRSGIPPCVCLSECTLPGLMSHCERYGRIGFAFDKHDIYRAGGRPCLYVGESEYGHLAEQGRGRDPLACPAGRLYGLSNVYVPPKTTGKIQDYTHEREWRIFEPLTFSRVSPRALLAPAQYVARVQGLVADVPVLPLDTLFDWGA